MRQLLWLDVVLRLFISFWKHWLMQGYKLAYHEIWLCN